MASNATRAKCEDFDSVTSYLGSLETRVRLSNSKTQLTIELYNASTLDLKKKIINSAEEVRAITGNQHTLRVNFLVTVVVFTVPFTK